MSNKILRKFCWFLTFAVMAVLFFSSSRSIEESREDSAAFMQMMGIVESKDDAIESANNPVFQLHIAVRKQAHFIAFLTLGALMFISLYGYVGKELKTAVFSWLGASLYGVFDEVHQIFTGRGASMSDVMLNSKSALIGVLIMCILFMIIESHPKLHALINKVYDIGIPRNVSDERG